MDKNRDLGPPMRSGADASTDAELVASARAGAASAFEVIMRRHNRLLFRTARGVVSDDAEAQDVVQETYLRAFTSLDSFRSEAALSTWLARIAINVALTAQRKRRRLVQMEVRGEDEIFPGEPLPEAMMPLRAADDESPEAMAERGQVRELLQAAVENLPPIYRCVFILRAVEDLSVDETAYCLGVSGDVVKTRFLRARILLRKSLAEAAKPYLRSTFSFAGARCDAVVNHVFAALGARGLVRSP
ncbi:RNA polymerase sigma factor [Cupriavidus neocaledonicus]|uniref:RNA polymerase sigma factor n=1 Tax=Cupriavidus neocaledonicus TaxID=1040979 RepID=A0A375HLU4_9BURK|nr:RNA polymerase sigma factor [Cupriavidus neocaledonicus]SOZ39112.1 RNA polymerase sigma factor [Cupriavidus neocaledonicus]SPD59218.1 RNA polymerase sigma factor [Cupriavidus neocaledonicus]